MMGWGHTPSSPHTHVAGLLDADGVLSELAAAMADQEGAVPSVDELRLRLEPLHRPSEPEAWQSHGMVYTHTHG